MAAANAIYLSLLRSPLLPPAASTRLPFTGRVRAMADPRPPPYPRAPLVEGRYYIDLTSGLTGNPLGKHDPDWKKAMFEASAGLTGNPLGRHDPDWKKAMVEGLEAIDASAFVLPGLAPAPMDELESYLVAYSLASRVLFTHNEDDANAEAMEVARYFNNISNTSSESEVYMEETAIRTIAFTNSYLGRMALDFTPRVILVTELERFMRDVTPMEFGDIDEAVELILTGEIASVFVEPITSTKDVLQTLRRACNTAGALLVFDEVQCGLGRTGFLWAYQAMGIIPDIMILGSPLSGGLPFGAVLLNMRVASLFLDYCPSFRAPLTMFKPALVILDKISNPGFLFNVSQKGGRFQRALVDKLGGNSHVRDVRGKGLIIDVEFDLPASTFVDACQDSGLLLSSQITGVFVSRLFKDKVVRLAPALVVSEDELDQAVDIMVRCLPVFDELEQ